MSGFLLIFSAMPAFSAHLSEGIRNCDRREKRRESQKSPLINEEKVNEGMRTPCLGEGKVEIRQTNFLHFVWAFLTDIVPDLLFPAFSSLQKQNHQKDRDVLPKSLWSGGRYILTPPPPAGIYTPPSLKRPTPGRASSGWGVGVYMCV